MVLLSKSDIINGKNNIQTVEFPELNGELLLRPLTDGEYHRVIKAITGKGIGNFGITPTIKDGEIDKDATMETVKLDLDVGVLEENSFKANCLAVSLSLTHDENDEKYTQKEVEQFPAGIVEKIAAKVYEITGVNDPKNMQAQMKSFR